MVDPITSVGRPSSPAGGLGSALFGDPLSVVCSPPHEQIESSSIPPGGGSPHTPDPVYSGGGDGGSGGGGNCPRAVPSFFDFPINQACQRQQRTDRERYRYRGVHQIDRPSMHTGVLLLLYGLDTYSRRELALAPGLAASGLGSVLHIQPAASRTSLGSPCLRV